MAVPYLEGMLTQASQIIQSALYQGATPQITSQDSSSHRDNICQQNADCISQYNQGSQDLFQCVQQNQTPQPTYAQRLASQIEQVGKCLSQLSYESLKNAEEHPDYGKVQLLKGRYTTSQGYQARLSSVVKIRNIEQTLDFFAGRRLADLKKVPRLDRVERRGPNLIFVIESKTALEKALSPPIAVSVRVSQRELPNGKFRVEWRGNQHAPKRYRGQPTIRFERYNVTFHLQPIAGYKDAYRVTQSIKTKVDDKTLSHYGLDGPGGLGFVMVDGLITKETNRRSREGFSRMVKMVESYE